MKLVLTCAFAVLIAGASYGQDTTSDVYSEEILIQNLDEPEYLELLSDDPKFEESAVQEQAAAGRLGHVRVLDRSSGRLKDFELAAGERVTFGHIEITLQECRFPTGNPSGDAYLRLDVSDETEMLFRGWMVASSPALSALDHARYDVWALRCTTE